MKRPLIAATIAAACSVSLAAKDPDRRLAIVKTAFVEAGDTLSDDQPIAACLREHLTTATTLTLADSRESADIVLKVFGGKVSGDSMRNLLGAMGLAQMDALLPDGTRLLNAYVNLSQQNKLDMRPVSEVPCMLADGLIGKLRQGMRKARDKK